MDFAGLEASPTAAAGTPVRRALIVIVPIVLVVAVLGSSAGAAPCGDTFIGPNEGSWAVSANWTAGVPTSSTVVCWGNATTVVVATGSQSADSIQSGGTLRVSGGTLALASTSNTSSLVVTAISGGTLELAGPAETGLLALSAGDVTGTLSSSLTVSGSIEWSGGSIGNGNGFSSKLKLIQTGGGTFSIFGTAETRVLGGVAVSIETTSPVSITNPKFRLTENARLTTTSTVTLAPLEYEETGSGTLTTTGLNHQRPHGRPLLQRPPDG